MVLDRSIAFVNLTSGKVETNAVPRSLRETWLGGRAINILLLHQRMASVADALAPESVVVIGAGLLCGTPVPGASACHFAYRSPLSGYLGSGTVMGHFAAELRASGFDHLVVSGKAPVLSVLFVRDGHVSTIPAEDLAGADTRETARRCRALVKDEEAQVVCIGPAGEGGVLLSDVRPSFGEGWGNAGLGAVFGAKNLKAVVVRGTGGLELASPKECLRLHRAQSQKILATKAGEALSKQGTASLLEPVLDRGLLRVAYSGWKVPPGIDKVGPCAVGKISPRSSSCFACPVACRLLVRTPGGGLEEGPGFESLAAFGALLGSTDLDAVLEADAASRRLGLHPWETGSALAWAASAFEKGTLKASQIGCDPPAFGEGSSLAGWVGRIASGLEFGGTLGAGIRRAADVLGPSALLGALHVKGMAMPLVDSRFLPSFALAAAVSSTGPDLQHAAPFAELQGLTEDALRELMSVPSVYDGPLSGSPSSTEGKAGLVAWQETFNMASDSLGICRYATSSVAPDLLGLPDLCEALRAATGLALSEAEIFRASERALCLERMFNLRLGLTRGDDTPGEAFFQKTSKRGAPALDPEGFRALLGEYYELRGCNPNGAPTDARIKELGLEGGPAQHL